MAGTETMDRLHTGDLCEEYKSRRGERDRQTETEREGERQTD